MGQYNFNCFHLSFFTRRLHIFATLRGKSSKQIQRRHYAVTRDFPIEELGLKHIAGSKKKCAVDIVAVHGLAADPLKTWTWRSRIANHGGHDGPDTDKRPGINWLKDLLPKALPRAHIRTFNYASGWFKDAPKENLRDIASRLLSSLLAERSDSEASEGNPEACQRPLIFIGHSFGGLVVQQALVLAAQNQKYKSLLLGTHSVFFLGTPHRGTKLASFGSMLSNCATALGMGSSNELLKNLHESADDMQNTVSDFAIQAREYNIDLVCFYELYETRLILSRLLRPTFSTMVVDRDSATLPGWRAIGLTTDHSGLNKFKSKDDANFHMVVAKLRERARSAPEAIQKRMKEFNAHEPMQPLHFIVPHMRNSTFRRRASIAEKVEALLVKAEALADHEQCRIALYGLAGSGKTQRCLELAYSSRDRKNILWINASTVESFNHTMSTIGRTVNLAEDGLITSQADLMIATKEWLESPRSGRWMLIVDGANNSSPDFMGYIEQFLPHQRGTIVFTSTTAQIIHAVGSPDMAVEIGPMSFTDASELFKKVSGLDAENEAQMHDLLEHLGHLPLAITQAASYIRARAITVGVYLNLMRGAEDVVRGLMFDASSADPHDYTATVSRSVMTTWKVTLDHIAQVNPEAIALLKFMSLLGPNIPIAVLKPFKNASPVLSDNVAFHNAIGLLISYCLVIPSYSNHISGDTYRLHRLAGMRARISMGSEKRHVVGIALDAIESLFPYPKPSKSNTVECSGLLQHAEAVLKHSSDFEELEDVRNQLRSKVELHKFYAYEYKRDKIAMLSSKSLHRKSPKGTDDPQELHRGPKMPEGLDYDLANN